MQQTNPMNSMNSMNPQQPQNQSGSTKLVLISLFLGLATAAMINFYLAQVRNVTRAETTLIFKTRAPLEEKDKFATNQYESVRIPKSLAREMEDAGFIVGIEKRNDQVTKKKKYTRNVNMGELLHESFFVTREMSSLGNAPEAGERRIPLRVNPKNLPAGLKPGHFVDILAPFPDPRTKKPKSMLVMEDIQILGLGKQTTYDEGGSSRSVPTITIDVRRDVAMMLTDLERIMSPTDGSRVFELHWRKPQGTGLNVQDPSRIDPGMISDEVITLYEKSYNVKIPKLRGLQKP